MKVRIKDGIKYYCRSCNKEMPQDKKNDREHIVYKDKCNCGSGGRIKYVE
jgi:hypothetical protein